MQAVCALKTFTEWDSSGTARRSTVLPKSAAFAIPVMPVGITDSRIPSEFAIPVEIWRISILFAVAMLFMITFALVAANLIFCNCWQNFWNFTERFPYFAN